MSDARVRRLYESQTLSVHQHPLIAAEELEDGTPLERPIRFNDFRNGCYVSTWEARRIANDLLAAVACVEGKK